METKPMSEQIDSRLKEDRSFEPANSFSEAASIKSLAEYDKLYQESIENPEAFWGKQAEENLHWFKKWDKVVESDFSSVGESASSLCRVFQRWKNKSFI